MWVGLTMYIDVGNEYKQAMKKGLRERGFVSVSVGLVNQFAQADSTFPKEYIMSYSDTITPLNNQTDTVSYATYEQNFIKLDGSKVFLPQDNIQFYKNEVVSKQLLGSIKVQYGNQYSIRGLTIDFGECYPTSFTVTTTEGTKTYSNNTSVFITSDVFDTSFVTITPITMIGGSQRLRIKRITMGVGLSYKNDDITSVSIDESCNSIAEDIYNLDVKVNAIDITNVYDVDNENSAINFLETGQKVSITMGQTLEDGSIEWLPVATGYLSSWGSSDGKMSFIAKSRFEMSKGTYSLGNKVYERTAYEEVESILTDMGLMQDEYIIDPYLMEITLINPITEDTHANCLQMVCNATKCVAVQDEYGKILVKANFATLLDSESIITTSTNATEYSDLASINNGSDFIYADYGENTIKLDGNYNFLPTTEAFKSGTGYVSSVIADENGDFTDNPKVNLKLPASTNFYSVYVNFANNPPSKFKITTYKNSTVRVSYEFDVEGNENYFVRDFTDFDEIDFEVTKGYPNNRVIISKVSFSNLSDYKLDKNTMTSKLSGYSDTKVKNVNVKIYSYDVDDDDNATLIDDDIYYTINVNTTGEEIYVENPLISNEDMAKEVAEWVGNYYKNNINYNVDYRGEPRLHAQDIIYLESNSDKNNLQTQIEKSKLEFKGAFSGSLELRKALKITL